MRGLDTKVALVTGSGRGIGNGIATRLAEEGATVAINDVETERAEDAATALQDEGYEALAVPFDVTDADATATGIESVIDEAGQLDILVNNAGWDHIDFFTDTEPALWDRIVDINYKGHLNTVHAAADHFMERESGKIVGISSDAGRVGSMGEAVYAGAKAGVIGFTKTMAREFARYDVQCNIVAPGPTDTPLLDEMAEESDLAKKIHGSMVDQVPLGRLGEPEDIAAAVAFLASDDADYVTGQVLSVSGGLTMC